MPEAKNTDFGQRIKRLREEAGITLTELAERVGVTKGYISQIESDSIKKVAANRLFDIAQVLGTDIGYLLGRRVVPEAGKAGAVTDELREFQERYDVPPGDIQMLASIEFRGNRPRTADGWKFIYEAIKHGGKM